MSDKFNTVDPEDYYDYEERYYKKGGKGGSKKKSEKRGKKTFEKMKSEQIEGAKENRREEAEVSLKGVFEKFPEFENEKERGEYLESYLNWLNDSLEEGPQIKESQLEESFSRSGGPGGQKVNKTETKALVKHIPTNIYVENQSTRSQKRNREEARKILKTELKNHLEDWQSYLGEDDEVSKELVLKMMEGQ